MPDRFRPKDNPPPPPPSLGRRVKRRVLRLEIVLRLAYARFLIRFVPFALWKRTLGSVGHESGDGGAAMLSEAKLRQAYAIGRITNYEAERLRLFRAICLPRAMAARWALSVRGIPSRIVIGSQSKTAMQGPQFHAWLMVGEHVITGAGERENYLAFRRAE